MSAVLIFVLGGVVADVMADGKVVDEVTTDAAVDDVVFLDFVADEMVFVDVVEVVMCVVVVVLTFGDITHAAGGLLVRDFLYIRHALEKPRCDDFHGKNWYRDG